MLADYCAAFEIDPDEVLDAEFTRVLPASGRPYAGLYTCM